MIAAVRDGLAEVEYPDGIPQPERTCSMFSICRVWIGDLTKDQARRSLLLVAETAMPAFTPTASALHQTAKAAFR
jgi:hypothetical protein